TPVNARCGTRINAALAYLALVRELPNFTIRSGVVVDRVELRAGRAAAVSLASPTETIGADIIILAAGTYGSPAILMRSGIGSLCAALLKPHSRGSVGLCSLDPAVPPTIDLALLTDDRDVRRLVEGLRHAHKLLATRHFDGTAEPGAQRRIVPSDDELRAHIW